MNNTNQIINIGLAIDYQTTLNIWNQSMIHSFWVKPSITGNPQVIFARCRAVRNKYYQYNEKKIDPLYGSKSSPIFLNKHEFKYYLYAESNIWPSIWKHSV